jgi:hypothetical protein
MIDAGIVTSFAVYFFYKVLTIPPRQDQTPLAKMMRIRQDAENKKFFYI